MMIADKVNKDIIRQQSLFPHRSIIVVTGGFDPLHSGHVSYLTAAMRTSAMVVVGLNSDDWLIRKKGQYFLPFEERKAILTSMYAVGAVIGFDDTDDTAKDAIRKVRELCPENEIIFGNGGDRTSENSPEMEIDDKNLKFEFGLGGEDKKNSSSWILEEWKFPKTARPWGYYRVLHNDLEKPNRTKITAEILQKATMQRAMHSDIPTDYAFEQDIQRTLGSQVKVKELTIDPSKSISFQKHDYRNELWFVSEGVAIVNLCDDADFSISDSKKYHRYSTISVPIGKYHKITNALNGEPLKIVEIQYGTYCGEDDIERVEEENIDFHLQG